MTDERLAKHVFDVLGYGLALKDRLDKGDRPHFEAEIDRLKGMLWGDSELGRSPAQVAGPKIDFLPTDNKDGIPRVFSYFMDALFNGTQMKLVNGGVNRRCYTYIDDAIECTNRIIENPGGVCDRQIFNIGSPYNEISIRQMAETMREIYAEKYRDNGTRLPDIVSVTGDEFYGEGYEDSDRRIPDIAKARTLLGWEPEWNVRDTIDATMRAHVEDYKKREAVTAAVHG